jgi:hypothetical protein
VAGFGSIRFSAGLVILDAFYAPRLRASLTFSSFCVSGFLVTVTGHVTGDSTIVAGQCEFSGVRRTVVPCLLSGVSIIGAESRRFAASNGIEGTKKFFPLFSFNVIPVL